MLLITGATGSLGRMILPTLLKSLKSQPENDLLIAVKNPARALKTFGNLLQDATIATVDLRHPEQVLRLQELPITKILHMAATTKAKGDLPFRQGNITATSNLLKLAELSNTEHFVHFSTDLVQKGFSDPYALSKKEAERRVALSKVPFTILRPALVMSPPLPDLQSGFLSLMKMCRLPVIPIFGDGKLRLKPLFYRDLARIVIRTLRTEPRRQAFNLAGQPVSIVDFFSLACKRLNTNPPRVHIPFSIAKLGIVGSARFAAMSRLPIPGALTLVDERTAPPFGNYRWLGFQPTTFPDALAACTPQSPRHT